MPSGEYTVDIRKGAREVIDSPLEAEPSLGTLRLSGAPSGAAVRVDNEFVGETGGDGSFVFEAVRPGNRVIQISRDGFQTKTVRASFEAGGSTNVDGAMEKGSGELIVSITPPDADALIVVRDSRGELVQLQNRRATLPVGGYRIETSASGFRSVTSEVRVRGGQDTVAEIRLEPLGPARPTGPQDLMSLLAEDPAWRRQGDRLTRRGGDFVLLPSQGAGTYRITVNLEKGRRLQWVVNYRDGANYGWFQMGRDNFIRALVSDGNRSRPVQVEHMMANFRAARIEIRVTNNEVVHRLRRNGEWVEIDRWRYTGANFTAGQFGFRLPGRDELVVAAASFTPAL